ncbi:MAG: DEAD/DEAH box helicase family protein [Flavobacteriales bacterium]|nr:DEAD/DEAH box helicase family protein [Flavobacteriales bacterium]
MNSLTPYQAKYFAYELTRKYPADDIGKFTASLQDAQVDLNPHQVEAALFAFKSPLSKGAILADEVGLGKTIEAGIILSQKWAERKRNLIIICPANLRKQWERELLDKFYLPSVILESKNYNKQIKDGAANPFDQKGIVICSYQFAAGKAPMLRAIRWDMVIIDEAHRLRNVYKPNNRIANTLKNALHPYHKILLTATPLQNSLLELYGLVSIIDEYTFGDIKSYKQQYIQSNDTDSFKELKSRLAPICKRTLRSQVKEFVPYTKRRAIVEDFYPGEDEQRLYDLVSDYLSRDNLYALPAGQRQLMTLILRKLLASSTFAIQGTLKGLADRLDNALLEQQALDQEELLRQEYEEYDDDKESWNEDDDSTEDEKAKDDPEHLTPEQRAELMKEAADLREFYRLAESIRVNSKGEKLMTALNKGFEMLRGFGANEKAIIFTESTRTQQYIQTILESNGFKDKMVLFNGSNTDSISKQIYSEWVQRHHGTDRVTGSRTADMRQALVDKFREDASIMIATEAAAEGINLQFCSLVMNYDLPWNPQRIEQRIGRCHRYGQKHDVVVVNFLNRKNAADVRVYELLNEKFQLFDGVFGASDEVLGAIGSGLDFEKRIAQIYRECRKPEEIEAAFNQLDKELRPEKEERLEETRNKLLENLDEEVIRKLKVNMTEGQKYLNQYEQWLWNITAFSLREYADFNLSENSFYLTTNPFPNEDIHRGPYMILRASAEKKKTDIRVNDDTNIYRVGHPLAQRIIAGCKQQKLNPCELTFQVTGATPKVSILETLVGKSGWLQVSCLTIASFETEEHLLFSGVLEDGISIDAETCQKLLGVNAEVSDIVTVPAIATKQLTKQQELLQKAALNDNMERNSHYFEEEYQKLDHWADDMKVSLEREISDMDAELKLKKGEVRKTVDLKEKVKLQREVNDLERKRSEKRRNLFEAQDEIDIKKDNLLQEIEQRLEQKVSTEELFCVKFNVS